MATLTVTSAQLDNIDRNMLLPAKNPRYIMIPGKGYHIRLDLKPFSSGKLWQQVGQTDVWRYQVSSFHVKRDLEHKTFVNATPGPTEGMKIVEDHSDYVYFKYVDGGVWQPLWGYYKEEMTAKGDSVWKESREMDGAAWAFACDAARWLLGQLTKALGKGQEQGLAMGPVQGSTAKLFAQL